MDQHVATRTPEWTVFSIPGNFSSPELCASAASQPIPSGPAFYWGDIVRSESERICVGNAIEWGADGSCACCNRGMASGWVSGYAYYEFTAAIPPPPPSLPPPQTYITVTVLYVNRHIRWSNSVVLNDAASAEECAANAIANWRQCGTSRWFSFYAWHDPNVTTPTQCKCTGSSASTSILANTVPSPDANGKGWTTYSYSSTQTGPPPPPFPPALPPAPASPPSPPPHTWAVPFRETGHISRYPDGQPSRNICPVSADGMCVSDGTGEYQRFDECLFQIQVDALVSASSWSLVRDVAGYTGYGTAGLYIGTGCNSTTIPFASDYACCPGSGTSVIEAVACGGQCTVEGQCTPYVGGSTRYFRTSMALRGSSCAPETPCTGRPP